MNALTDSIVLQLAGALFLGAISVLFCYKAPLKAVIITLILLIPFQILENRFGTLNVALVYLVAFIMLIRNELRIFPLKKPILILMLAYLVSFSQVHPVQNVDHLLYLFSLISAFLMFILIYNFAVTAPDYRYLINTLHGLNALVLLYCILQAYLGKHTTLHLPGGIEIGLERARAGDDVRLAGPFGATMPGLLAEYMVISILLCLYDFAFSNQSRRKVYLVFLMVFNLGCLFATGNRGGLLGLVPFSFALMLILRHQLGALNILKFMTAAIILSLAAGFVVVKYTSYNRLFDRLLETKVENGVPDTRERTWGDAILVFEQKPWFGNGPRLRLNDEGSIWIPDHKVIDYPHNLYLYLLCTVGIIGLLVYLLFFVSLIFRISWRVGNSTTDPFLATWSKLGCLIVLYILVDQIKIEFTRYTATDYWHYLYMLFGVILGLSDRAKGGPASVSEGIQYQIVGSRVVRTQ